MVNAVVYQDSTLALLSKQKRVKSSWQLRNIMEDDIQQIGREGEDSAIILHMFGTMPGSPRVPNIVCVLPYRASGLIRCRINCQKVPIHRS